MTNITLRNDLNGIEIRFDGKPAAEVIYSLKENGFRWSGKQKMWYAKQSASRIDFAMSIESKENSGDTIFNAIKNKAEQVPTYDLWEMTRTDSIEDNYGKYRIHDCKEIAAIIRKHIRTRFKMCKWSVTSDYSSIDIDLLSSPFAKDSEEVKAIVHYVYKFAQSYNYDNSDYMSDYFDVNFYGVHEGSIVSWKYEQTELTVEMKNISDKFQERKAEFEKAEAEREEREFQERMAQREIERKESERIRAEADAIHEKIEANHTVKEVNYFVMNVDTSTVNKMNSVSSIEEYEEHHRENCKVTREVRMTEEIYQLFSNHLLADYSFLAGMGGTATDDLRVQSMDDYRMMDKDDRETVEWYNTNCVAVYCGDELKLVINPEGFSYARYTYIVDSEGYRIDDYNGASGISEEEYQKNLELAETIEDVSAGIIVNNDLQNTWDKDGFDTYRVLMKEWIYSHDFKFNVGVIRAVENERLKVALYRIYREVVSISEQFKRADLKPGQRLTLIYISDFGGIVTHRVTFEEARYGRYAQYENAVKLIYKPQKGRNLCYNWFHRDMLVFDGWFELPESVLWEELPSVNGVALKKTRFLSCDNKQYDAVLDYFKSIGVKPIINTYKPQF